jgi:hypothetical protein
MRNMRSHHALLHTWLQGAELYCETAEILILWVGDNPRGDARFSTVSPLQPRISRHNRTSTMRRRPNVGGGGDLLTLHLLLSVYHPDFLFGNKLKYLSSRPVECHIRNEELGSDGMKNVLRGPGYRTSWGDDKWINSLWSSGGVMISVGKIE